MKTDYNSYLPIALTAAKKMGIRLDRNDLHDVMTALWESHERFLDKANAQDRELTPEENQHLSNRLFVRAYGAIVDLIRFKTWVTRTGQDSTRLKPELHRVPEKVNHDAFFEKRMNSLDFVSLIENKITLENMPEAELIKEYLTGSTMKEIGLKRGLTEARVSQIFKELT